MQEFVDQMNQVVTQTGERQGKIQQEINDQRQALNEEIRQLDAELKQVGSPDHARELASAGNFAGLETSKNRAKQIPILIAQKRVELARLDVKEQAKNIELYSEATGLSVPIRLEAEKAFRQLQEQFNFVTGQHASYTQAIGGFNHSQMRAREQLEGAQKRLQMVIDQAAGIAPEPVREGHQLIDLDQLARR